MLLLAMSRDLVRGTVSALEGYAPGEQPAPGRRIVKLNTNESPYPPSPRVIEAIRSVQPEALRRYPRPLADEFRMAAAKALGIPEDSILAGNGSDDILTIATRTFLGPGDTLAYPVPTYSLYPVLARLQDAQVAPVPLGRRMVPARGGSGRDGRACHLPGEPERTERHGRAYRGR
jgi:histidinol-phosphate aminotransferase